MTLSLLASHVNVFGAALLQELASRPENAATPASNAECGNHDPAAARGRGIQVRDPRWPRHGQSVVEPIR